MNLDIISSNKSFGGWHKQYRHRSTVLDCEMRFAIYLPPLALTGQKVPVLYWLSGLTCTDENFMQKAGAQRIAAELGIALVAPDTSPRGEGVPDDPGYDLGMGAGFYVNATQHPWRAHYQMYDYVTRELPELIETHFPVSTRRAISGHSMGGHGALIAALREPGRYRSVSAFSPISHPSRAPWGQKALGAYLGNNPLLWQEWDACQLLRHHDCQPLPTLVEVGLDDPFLTEQLGIDALAEIAAAKAWPLELHRHAGYDHSYYFVASFIEAHLRFHASHLGDPARE
ncbi:MAG: S-formylglutathione hydrolase [Aeromonas sp.]|jgi:S-formylglutathione hydrolase|uniref:S-formylglutathione hydrolase n=1 Tax=Aeromonas media TaxID=651 RepID=UPI00028624DF|nr:S-formylglutathione hydrolase [Aeromonas media]MBP6071646.1 S-formylglutathione hydrolase [Aeromonas sp.]AHX63157.1 esterase YeiG [Aeromonas media WS]MBP6166422.1 S-formylglutathione hydrolase [Aeromonas sp.]MBP8079108.1 S-formylglutathione hydrolase [Aeromonas sp.]MBP8112488.1 S-formylglutathione hydrolase [Aeromonas sp.]